MTGLDLNPRRDTVAEHPDANGAPPPGPTTGVVRSSLWRLGLVILSLVALGVFVSVPVLLLVLALMICIALHELGHFLAARRAGMKVTEFFIGMGPRLWSTRRGEVEYGLKAIPLGAYVRIIGMSNLEEVDPAEESRGYRAKGYWRRLSTVLAGPAVNIGIGVVLFFGLFAATGVSSPDNWSVGRVVPGGAAEAAGVQPGDRIVAVDGEAVSGWEAFTTAVDDRAGQSVELTVDRNGATETLVADLRWALSGAGVAALPTQPTLRSGATVVSVDGQSVGTYEEFAAVMATGTGPTEVVFEMGTGTYAAVLERPLALPADGGRGFLGVSMGGAEQASAVGPVDAARESVGMVGTVGTSMIDFLGRLFTPSGMARYAELVTGGSDPAPTATPQDRAPLVPVDGADPLPSAVPAPTTTEDAAIRPLSIIGIVQVGDQLSGADGIASVIFLLAMVNVFLGLVNLLPLLPFDGGHATVATYEAIRGAIARKPYRIDAAKLMPLTYVVVFILLGIGLSAMWLDITDPVRIVP
jgi:membrane-associated protease RseP (regulator of RpoE activity)